MKEPGEALLTPVQFDTEYECQVSGQEIQHEHHGRIDAGHQ